MGTLSRFKDLVNANLNDLLDQAEDPEKLLRLAVSHMEAALDEARGIVAECLTEMKAARRRIAWLEQRDGEWQARAEQALEQSREDLSRDALRHALAARREIETLEPELARMEARRQDVEADAARLAERLETARVRLRELRPAAPARAPAPGGRSELRALLNRFRDLEFKMDHLEARAEWQVGGWSEPAPDPWQDLDDLALREAVDRELHAMKARRAEA